MRSSVGSLQGLFSFFYVGKICPLHGMNKWSDVSVRVYWSFVPQFSQNRASVFTGLPQLGQNLFADCGGCCIWLGGGGIGAGWLGGGG